MNKTIALVISQDPAILDAVMHALRDSIRYDLDNGQHLIGDEAIDRMLSRVAVKRELLRELRNIVFPETK